MSPRTLSVAAFIGLLVAPCAAPVVAQPAHAQTFGTASVSPSDVAAAQAAAQAYTDAQTAALQSNLTSPASVANFGSAMIASGQVQPAGSYATTTALNNAVTNVPSQAPVQKVNGLTGNVVLPTYTRQTNASPVAVDSSGNATFTYGTAFTNLPGCQVEVISTATNYVFAQPVTTAKSLTSVTINVQAALKVLSISLGALTVWTSPPAGTTTVNFYCIAQN